MKSWQLQKFGIENLELVDEPDPKPGPKQILVRTKAVSLNFRDQAIIMGHYNDPVAFPLVPGSDLAGDVVAIGEKVTRFTIGDQVVTVFKPLWQEGTPTPELTKVDLHFPVKNWQPQSSHNFGNPSYVTSKYRSGRTRPIHLQPRNEHLAVEQTSLPISRTPQPVR